MMYQLARPLLFSLDAERAHNLTLDVAKRISDSPFLCNLASKTWAVPSPGLEVEAFGCQFANPIGLAAGLDKNGVAIDFWAALGFGFVEVGTVTPGTGQVGNEPPRLQRLVESGALVNRMGFNNKGTLALAFQAQGRRTNIPLGINLGKAKDTSLENAANDYLYSFLLVENTADYVVVNVSSPNTVGLRTLQAPDALAKILRGIQGANPNGVPILVKVAPDLVNEELEELATVALQWKVSGLIATNTTINTPDLKLPFAGGVSGRPLRKRALEVTKLLYRTVGTQMPIISVGGIWTAEDVLERIRAGATLVQVFTSFVYEGPELVSQLVRGLTRLLARDNVKLKDIVGTET
jgi:dihydroorotate dehydrogenase